MNNGSRNSLYQLIRKEYGKKPIDLSMHKRIAEIPQIREIITTNYDCAIELAFEEVFGTERLHVIKQSKDLSFGNKDQVRLIKVHGDIDRLEKVVITDSDYREFFTGQNENSLWKTVSSSMARNSLLFVGYSLDDPNVEYLFNHILEQLKPFHRESFIVAPGMPKYKIDKLANLQLHYIDMTGEELFLIIHTEILKNLVSDVQQGLISLMDASKILKAKGLEPTFALEPSGSPILKGIASSQNVLNGKLTFGAHKEIMEQIKQATNGDSFEEVVLSGEQILSFSSQFYGMNLFNVEPGQTMQLSIKPSPLWEKTADLILVNDSNECSVEQAKISFYHSPSLSQIDIEKDDFRLSFKQYNDDRGTRIDIKFGLPENCFEGWRLYKLVHGWLNGYDIKVLTEDIPMTLPSVEDPLTVADAEKSVANYLHMYESLIRIQRYFELKLYVPSEITDQDREKVEILNTFVNHERYNVDQLVIIAEDYQDIEEMLREESFPFKTKVSELVKFSLFGNEFVLGYPIVEAIDAYVSNPDEVRDTAAAGEEPPIVLRSRSNEMYAVFEPWQKLSEN